MADPISYPGLATSLLLPWCLGGIWVHWLFVRSRQPCNWFVVTGLGYFAGIFFTALVVQLWGTANLEASFWKISIFLLVLASGGLLAHGKERGMAWNSQPRAEWPLWQTAVIIILAGLLVWRQESLFRELATKPLYGWDAWMNWAPKAVVWFHRGELVDFVSPEQWLLQSGSTPVYTLGNHDAWAYPPGVPLILLWGMLGAGTSDHSYIYLPWIMASANLGVALYGHLRLAGASVLTALVACYLLLSLPYINVHTVIAGYADLWLTAAFSLAVFALHEWDKQRNWSWGLLCLAFGAMCSQLKTPGLILSMIVLVTFTRSLLRVRYKTELLTVAMILAIIGCSLVFGINLSIPFLGNLNISGQSIDMPLFGHFELEYHPVGGALIQSLFLMINWNILWYLLLPLFILKVWHGALLEPVSNELLAILLVMLFFIFVFFFTYKFINVLDFTTVNRALLYPVPALIFYIFLQFRPSGESPVNKYTS